MNRRRILLPFALFLLGLVTAFGPVMSVRQGANQCDAVCLTPGCRVTVSNRSTVGFEVPTANSSFGSSVSAKATVLITIRPKQLVASEFAPLAEGGAAQELFIGNPEHIDLVMVATTNETIGNLISYRASQLFHEIASELTARGDELDGYGRTDPIKANYLNQDFTAYVRFDKPMEWVALEKWYESDKRFEGKLTVQDIDGFEVLESDVPNSCAVLKLDERSYLIGNKSQLLGGVKAKQPENQHVMQWLEELETADFEGELFVGKRVDPASTIPGFLSSAGRWRVLSEVSQYKLAIDLSGESMVELDLEFSTDQKAAAFHSLIDNAIESAAAEMEGMVVAQGQTQADRQPDLMTEVYGLQMQQIATLARSIRVNNTESIATITLPRPLEFESLAKQYFENQRRLTRYHEQKIEPFEPVVQVDTVQVFVAKRRIRKGAVFTPDDIKIESWPKQIVPEGSIKSLSSIKNRKAKVEINQGLPLTQQHVE